ncbi:MULTISPECIES: hypothetical protein [Cysteiniphilum]|uniref:Uncharacterized protein n=1 Tax=Cysteiniphilum litorale TaxID=2056700 RepID=A0A8J3E899_9GAMM|nr:MULTISPECIES: hypothetical protein [Cysteiniphilum]GGF91382.1 hypothetical protein GCM10010995_05790 [Cysteiniphilum litorale]
MTTKYNYIPDAPNTPQELLKFISECIDIDINDLPTSSEELLEYLATHLENIETDVKDIQSELTEKEEEWELTSQLYDKTVTVFNNKNS